MLSTLLICDDIFSTRQVVCVTVQTSSGNAVANGFTVVQEYVVFVTPNDLVKHLTNVNKLGIAKVHCDNERDDQNL